MRYVFVLLLSMTVSAGSFGEPNGLGEEINTSILKFYLASPEESGSASNRLEVFIDGENQGYLEPGLDIGLHVSPGERMLEVQGVRNFRDVLEMNVVPGKTYYLVIEDDLLSEVSLDRFLEIREKPVPERWSKTEKVLFAVALPILIPLSLVAYLFAGS